MTATLCPIGECPCSGTPPSPPQEPCSYPTNSPGWLLSLHHWVNGIYNNEDSRPLMRVRVPQITSIVNPALALTLAAQLQPFTEAWMPVLTFRNTRVLFVFGATPRRAQDLLLSPCSMITPGWAYETMWDTGDKIQVSLIQSKSHPHCTILLVTALVSWGEKRHQQTSK